MPLQAGIPTPARIVAVATHVPEEILSNEQLALEFPTWTAEKILEKTGIRERRIAAADETALDLATKAAEKLFVQMPDARDGIDFIILCTQAPDYILPSSACILQDRLKLGTHVGALDINLGCSGFVYGLTLAAGLIGAGAARNVLLVTADTYSKYINARDKSVRTLFGDGAAATLVQSDPDGTSALGPFVFGTDGSGADRLIVPAGGFRSPLGYDSATEVEDRSGNIRSENDLFMDGAAVMSFSLREVPKMYRDILDKAQLETTDLSAVILHQANKFMLDSLQKKLHLTDDRLPRRYEHIGNTVSSTIPFVIEQEMASGSLRRGSRAALLGFGVGLSWAGAIVTF